MSIFEYNEKLHEQTLRDEGEEIGIAIGITNLITSLRELNIPEGQIIEQLVKRYELTPQEAEKRVRIDT